MREQCCKYACPNGDCVECIHQRPTAVRVVWQGPEGTRVGRNCESVSEAQAFIGSLERAGFMVEHVS